MFQVENKETKKTYNVFNISKEADQTLFLVYYNDSWEWIDCTLFQPFTEYLY